ncbi:hypothetical protein TNCV_5133811 [Trichonephila clavipes]|nr:hypothetical protein TNCV_5133811 [Trichonephila clavipes]
MKICRVEELEHVTSVEAKSPAIGLVWKFEAGGAQVLSFVITENIGASVRLAFGPQAESYKGLRSRRQSGFGLLDSWAPPRCGGLRFAIGLMVVMKKLC